ncbi:MAG: superendonuclease family protein, partial [Polaromonas sp.]|nr:superendonuclease family protein [Polaromonas sp.]
LPNRLQLEFGRVLPTRLMTCHFPTPCPIYTRVKNYVLQGQPHWDGLKSHRSALVRQYLDSLDGQIEIAFLPPYAPDLNSVEYLWTWLKRHALANYCPNNLRQLQATARNKLKSVQKRPSIIALAGNKRRFGNVIRY